MGDGTAEPTAPEAVFTLLVDCGRAPDDGLPQDATGARLLCYIAARDEAEAVRGAVAVLKDAGLAPLDVTSYGTLDDRLAEDDLDPEERALIDRAAEEKALVVAEMTPRFGEETE